MNTKQTHGAILLRNTMAFDPQHVSEFKQAIKKAVEFAEKHAPQLMVQVYIDQEQALAYSFQLYEDSDAIIHHWEISDPYINEVMKYCEVQSMEIYGNPAEDVRSGILDSVGDANVTFTPELVGFYRINRDT